MLENNPLNLSNILLYNTINCYLVKRYTLPKKPFINFLEKSHYPKYGHTGRFFKKSAFIVLAIAALNFGKFKKLTIRSTLFVLWNMINAYTIIF